MSCGPQACCRRTCCVRPSWAAPHLHQREPDAARFIGDTSPQVCPWAGHPQAVLQGDVHLYVMVYVREECLILPQEESLAWLIEA